MSAQLDIEFSADAKRDIDRLVPVAQELARRAGKHGVTVADLRTIAESRNLLTGEERGRRLSFLGAVMKKAGLAQAGTFRRSHIGKSHGNLNAVWVLPEFVKREEVA